MSRFLDASRIAMLAVAVVAMSGAASAQTAPPPHTPLQKTIGAAKPEVVPSLFVINSRGASLQGSKLTLTGVSPNAIVFADRPVRSAGHDLTSRIVEDWGSGSDNFAKDPPNATVSVFQKDGNGVRDVVVVLKTPSSRVTILRSTSTCSKAKSREPTARRRCSSISLAAR